MITKTQSFQTADGNVYQTLEIAQRAALFQLLAGEPFNDEENGKICTRIYENREGICAILGATGRKPRGKSKGNGKPRRTRTNAQEVAK